MKNVFIVSTFMQALFLMPASVFAAPPKTITIIIEPVFNGQPLQLSDQYYINEHGDTLYIDLFRFYITNVVPGNDGRTSDVVREGHLIDAETGSLSFPLSVAAGRYSELTFIAGVDSIANTSGANSGDLDPIKGMYWAWNSGYIMAKLEGHSKVCKTLHHAFEFHIGGYTPPNNAARTVRLSLPSPIDLEGKDHAIIKIRADAAAWFRDNLDLAKVNSIVIPGKEACGMADRYARMFSVNEIRYE